MSELIKHECGIALVRLLQPIDYYKKKYGSTYYGLNKLFLLMEKQRNRGQDGAGIATIKYDMPAGERYISKYKSVSSEAINNIYEKVYSKIAQVEKQDASRTEDIDWLKQQIPALGELMLGHLRYATYGESGLEFCHPVLRQNNWMTRNLILAGNFNLTNSDQLFDLLVKIGQHPRQKSDTISILEKIGHFLDDENQRMFDKYKKAGKGNLKISKLIAEKIQIQNILKRSVKDLDGGYTLAGLIGHGDAFVLRDPAGIRPAFYYKDDEVVVAASERPAIQTAFNVPVEEIHEVKPGHALIIKKNGKTREYTIKEPTEKRSCSFERIYFSRGNDIDIYNERKKLGYYVVPKILDAIDYNIKQTVFSFIPNTAESAFYGMVKGVEEYLDSKKYKLVSKYMKEMLHGKGKDVLAEVEVKKRRAQHAVKDTKEHRWEELQYTQLFNGNGSNSENEISEKEFQKKLRNIISLRPRVEKIAVKDINLRTFITSDATRNDLVAHVYDVTYGIVKRNVDTLVILDDSIVRGTTLKLSIINMLDRLGPKKIVIVSSAPQIRYPDCYGIDMSKLGDFVAFRAAISLLKETGKQHIIDEVYNACKKQDKLPLQKITNEVMRIYEPFDYTQISDRVAQIVTPENVKAEVNIIYQEVSDLHKACPDHKGDWYFSGNYPTPGGNRVVNRAFINFVEEVNERAY